MSDIKHSSFKTFYTKQLFLIDLISEGEGAWYSNLRYKQEI